MNGADDLQPGGVHAQFGPDVAFGVAPRQGRSPVVDGFSFQGGEILSVVLFALPRSGLMRRPHGAVRKDFAVLLFVPDGRSPDAVQPFRVSGDFHVNGIVAVVHPQPRPKAAAIPAGDGLQFGLELFVGKNRGGVMLGNDLVGGFLGGPEHPQHDVRVGMIFDGAPLLVGEHAIQKAGVPRLSGDARFGKIDDVIAHEQQSRPVPSERVVR